MEIINIKNLNKAYGKHQLFQNFNLTIQSGEFVLLKGKSGCGKSTLINMIGLLEKMDQGEYTLFDQKNIQPNTKESKLLLRNKISFIFQNFALMDDDTVENNLLIALEYTSLSKQEKQIKIDEVLKQVQLEGMSEQKIYTLSGGQQQRVALARCLLKPSDLVLADEPTAALDQENKQIVLDLLCTLQKLGKTVIVASHDDIFDSYCSRMIEL